VSVDRTKVLEAAQKHLAKGAFDKAIAEFQKLVVADPSDVRTWLKIGDLQSKIGKAKDAVDTYMRVADQYSGQGFHLKAVAVHKQILKLDGTRLDVQLKLAAAYESLQLVSDALGTFEQVAAAQARSGDIPAAVNTLARMVELDPESVPTRIKYAEALSRTGRTKDAADAFEAGASLLKSQGRIDDYLKVAERLLYHREGDVELSRELARLYLERNDAKRALAKLQTSFKSDPKHVPTLELLAQAFEQLGQLPKTISVYREVARIHGEAGKGPERAATLKRILELDPGDAEARQALASFANQPKSVAPPRRDLAPPPGAVVEPSGRLGHDRVGHEAARAAAIAASAGRDLDDQTLHGDPMEMEDDDVIVDSDEGEMVESELSEAEAEALAALDADIDGEAIEADELAGDLPTRGDEGDSVEEAVDVGDGDDVVIVEDGVESIRAPQEVPASLPPEVAREAQIAKLLTECDVYLRYGLKQKVVDQLRRVLDIDPSHVEAREKLKDVLVDRGENAAAAAELMVLADLFSAAKPSLASLYLRQAAELDPGNPELEARMASFAASAPSSSGSLRAPHPDFEPPTTDRAANVAAAPPPSSQSISVPKPKGLVPRPVMPPPAPDSIPPASPSIPPEDGVFFVEDEAATGEEIPPASEKTAYDEIRADDLLDPMSPEEFEKAPLRPSLVDVGMDRVSRPSLPAGRGRGDPRRGGVLRRAGPLRGGHRQVLRDASPRTRRTASSRQDRGDRGASRARRRGDEGRVAARRRRSTTASSSPRSSPTSSAQHARGQRRPRRRAGVRAVQEGRRAAGRRRRHRHALRSRHRLQGDGPHRGRDPRVRALPRQRVARVHGAHDDRPLSPREERRAVGHRRLQEGPLRRAEDRARRARALLRARPRLRARCAIRRRRSTTTRRSRSATRRSATCRTASTRSPSRAAQDPPRPRPTRISTRPSTS
jgi:tetratricopeptide (TPR) repeat protein